jgi:hypothetical protein
VSFLSFHAALCVLCENKKADAVFTVSAACRLIENYLAFDHAVSDTLVAGARFRPMRLIVSVVNRMSRAV